MISLCNRKIFRSQPRTMIRFRDATASCHPSRALESPIRPISAIIELGMSQRHL
jgi:hypothetical protein